MMKLNIQRFGGRGASSSNTREINGVQVVKSTSGYRYWNIGRNAPEGYIGLIQGQGASAKTAYIKSQYADEIANFRSAGDSAMNYDNIRTLDRVISTREKTIERYKNNDRDTTRLERELKEMKRAREIRQKLGL